MRKKNHKKIINLLLWTLLLCGTLFLFHEPIKNLLVSLGINTIGIDKISADDIKKNNGKNSSFDFDEVQDVFCKKKVHSCARNFAEFCHPIVLIY
ncbi:hypothetical protein AB3M95_25715, partial [Metabacillus niabensis]